MTTLEKLAITCQALSRPTLLNRYRFWRHVEGCDVLSAAFMAVVGLLLMAVVGLLRQGD